MAEDEAIDLALTAATEADTREALWQALEPHAAAIETRADLAYVWVQALRTSPGRPTLVDEATRILEAFPADPPAVLGACAALIRAAERPVDEPPLVEGPASVAAAAAARCLSRISKDERADPDVGGALEAIRGNALALLGPKRADEAVAALEAASQTDPERGRWHYDLALLHKRRRDFEAALTAAQAARRLDGDKSVILMNLAVAACGAGHASEAAEAWRALGMPTLETGTLPRVEGLEPMQVRLPTRGPGHLLAEHVPDEAASYEMVWVAPLSPCHGVVRSPTFREAVADFGDVVLFDVAPVSVRETEGRRVPCFPLLGLLAKGDERRFRFLAMQQAAGQIETLADALPEGVVLYPHGERVERVCPRCAAGETLTKHEHLPAEEHRVAFGKLVVPGALDLGEAAKALEAARRAQPGVRMAIPGLYEALGKTKEAGAHHKRWGVIERARGR